MLIKTIKMVLLTGTIALLSLNVTAQNPGFEQTDIIKVSGVTTDAGINALPLGNIQTTRVYIDGLGRSVQAVALQASPVNNKDIVQPQAYNTLGQQTVGYLPYTDNSTINPIGSFRTTAINDQVSYYANSGTNSNPNAVANEPTYPYSQQLFENSPLQRVMSAGMTGTGFQPTVSGNKFKTVSYRLNNSAQDGSIMLWTTSGTYTLGTNYGDNTLYVTDGLDEDGLEARSFTDAAGRVVLKRQLNSGTNVDTYYVYNVGGAISYIIPPLAVASMVSSGNYSLASSPVNTMIFVFTYDGLGRLVEKTVPAKGKVSIVYDPLNRPVLMQDANMLANKQWNYIRYDVKGRAISQGIYLDTTRRGRSAMQTYVSGLAYTTWYESRNTTQSTGYYSANVFPTTATGTLTPLAYAYFDDYYLNPSGTAYSYVPQGLGVNEETATTAPVKGMPTMVRKTTVGAAFSGIWLLNVTFFDRRLNPIQTQSNNQLNYTLDVLTDNKTMVPDFMGVPQIAFVKKVTGASATPTVQTNLSYDYMYRIKTVTQNYNGAAAVTVASYTYNEMGQLVKKGLGLVSGTTFLQNVDMRYNIRGMLTTINNSTLTNDSGTGNTNSDTNDAFGMQILYDQTDTNLGNTPYYNGRISGVKWMSLDGSGNKSYERAFRYYYDGMGRDTAAIYGQRPAGSPSTTAFTITNGWNENRITYDAGGNIKTMFRDSSVQGTNSHYPIDNLIYTYNTASNPNQLLTVTDGTGSAYTNSGFRNRTGSSANYTYDANGNLMLDPYKGLQFGNYNVLNRTDKITCTAYSGQYIDYTYDASGNLIRKRQYNNSVLDYTTDYLDGFVYLTTGAGSPVLQYFPMPEGRVVYSGGTCTPTYTIADHLGNVRVEFDNSGTGGIAKVRQENSYYAFGLVMPGSAVGTPGNDNKNLFNGGSEWQKDYANLPDYYQTFNRNYDAALGRWVGVDPVAESAESMTPYQYAGNNPITYNDPLGDKMKLPQDITGTGYSPKNTGDGFSWANGGSGVGGGGEGLYNTDPGAYWILYNLSGGTFGGNSTYHSGDNTKNNPSTGMTQDQLQALVNNSSGIKLTSDGIKFGTKGGYKENPNWNPTDAGSTKLDNLQYLSIAPQTYFISFGEIKSFLMDNLPVRGEIPDLIAVNISTTKAGPFGGWNQTIQFNLLTRGPQQGFFVTSSQTKGQRYGAEISVSMSLVSGWYLNSVDQMNRSTLEGTGFDVSMDIGIGFGLWDGREPTGFLKLPQWVGCSVSIGPAIGASAGFSNTTIVK
jgi:RHS repeat-associated protein